MLREILEGVLGNKIVKRVSGRILRKNLLLFSIKDYI
jgi:hypothetical protein